MNKRQAADWAAVVLEAAGMLEHPNAFSEDVRSKYATRLANLYLELRPVPLCDSDGCILPKGHGGAWHDDGVACWATDGTPTFARSEFVPWVIWSHEHAAYWRQNQRGYAENVLAAGIYSEQEAKEIAERVSRDPSKKTEARPLEGEIRTCVGTAGDWLRQK